MRRILLLFKQIKHLFGKIDLNHHGKFQILCKVFTMNLKLMKNLKIYLSKIMNNNKKIKNKNHQVHLINK